MIKMLIFYIQEIAAIIQLFVQLMQLVANILSLATIIAWFMNDLKAAQNYLQKRMLWMERAVNRVKQKVQKNLEWIKRTVTIKINEIFTKAQIQYYQKQLDTAKAGQTATQDKITQNNAVPTASIMTGSSYNAPLSSYGSSTTNTSSWAANSSLGTMSLRSTTPLDSNGQAYLPVGQYPSDSTLLAMYPNPMGDKSNSSILAAQAAYDAARTSATPAASTPNTYGGVSNNLFAPSVTNNSAAISSNIATDKTLQAQASASKQIVSVLQAKVDSLNKDLASYPVQRQAIEDDKTYWNAKWAKEAADDKAALVDDVPKIGANCNV